MTDLAPTLEPIAERLLAPGERLAGCCLTTQHNFFRGWMVLLAVTDRRLLMQKLDRRFGLDGESRSIPPSALVDAEASLPSDDWWSPTSALMDAAAVIVRLRLRDGSKIKLCLMRGGEGLLGRLGGGEGQRRGLEALGRWLAAAQGGG